MRQRAWGTIAGRRHGERQTKLGSQSSSYRGWAGSWNEASLGGAYMLEGDAMRSSTCEQ